jgi:hypothetical protein
MARKRLWLVAIGFVLGVGAVPFAGCDGSLGTGSSAAGGSSANANGGSAANANGGSGGGFFDPDAGGPTCEGLECAVDNCSGNPEATTISGTAFAPNGTLPLYNVIVYVPKYPEQPLEPITLGAECEQCPTEISNAVATALTDPTGHFTLEAVPSGQDIPLVVQIGKWRRKVVLPTVQPCADNPLADPEQTRLPRDKSEGDIPQMTIVTGGCDPLPCLFRKMGLSDSEYTDSAGTGRMHVYQGVGGAVVDGGNALAPDQSLWSSVQTLTPYDIVILSCECDEYNQFKSPAQMGFMRDYLNSGGRVFATHYHYTWFKNGPPEFQSVATWLSPGSVNPYTIDTSFPKGAAFVEWLHTVSPTIVNDQINLTSIREDVGVINPAVAQRWIYQPQGQLAESVKYFTFNTPIGTPEDMQCGRAVFSDIHVSEGGVANVPSGCDQNPLTDQEKALIFLFFDLAACITPGDGPPVPPTPQ